MFEHRNHERRRNGTALYRPEPKSRCYIRRKMYHHKSKSRNRQSARGTFRCACAGHKRKERDRGDRYRAGQIRYVSQRICPLSHAKRVFPLDYGRYIEVFGGGGWVLFHKPPGKEMEVYNDFNGNLTNLYRCVSGYVPYALCSHHGTCRGDNVFSPDRLQTVS